MIGTDAFRLAILAALGHAPDEIEPGRLQRFSTNGKRGDTAGWCKQFADLRAGVFGCYRAGFSEVWTASDQRTLNRQQRVDLVRQVAAATAERAIEQRQQWARAAEQIARTWAECVLLVPGDAVTRYFERRGFGGLWPLPACLRLHRGLGYWSEGELLGTFPAMVAPIVAPDGRVVALHRTYLTSDGRKAEVTTVRKLTRAAGPMAGAAIPLHQPQRGVIGVAEGIETALAAWLGSGVPTMAAYSAGNLAAWQWPAGVQRLVIFADHDRAGREAADKLRGRAMAARIRVDVLAPSAPGEDWNDVLVAAGAAA